MVATLDDLLIEDGQIASFSTEGPTHTAMGRFGNVMLTSGKTDPHLDVRTGDVVRFFIVNTANTRIFNVSIPGADMKLVGGDSGRYEREEYVDSVLLAPSERAVVDVPLHRARRVRRSSTTPPTSRYRLGAVTVTDGPAETPQTRRRSRPCTATTELAAERERLDDGPEPAAGQDARPRRRDAAPLRRDRRTGGPRGPARCTPTWSAPSRGPARSAA